MNALLRKEIRLILPAWILALALAILPVWLLWPIASGSNHQAPGVLVWGPFAIGAFLLGLAPFGHELNYGTFSIFLAQPVSRRRLWRTKTSVLGAALVLAFAALCVSDAVRVTSVIEGLEVSEWLPAWSHLGTRTLILRLIQGFYHDNLFSTMIYGGISALAAFAGGLWTNLLFRNISAAFWCSLLVPLGLGFLIENLLGDINPLVADAVLIATLGIYSGAGFFWARKFFLRVEDSQWTGGAISLSLRRGLETEARSGVSIRKRKPLRALLAKEIQLHQISFVLAVGLLAFHLVTLIFRKFSAAPPNSQLRFALEAVPFLWLMMPWVLGSAAVAEERKLGTLQSQLCLPVSRRAQFTVKLGIALLAGVLLGGVVPWAIENIAARAGIHSGLVNLSTAGLGFTEALIGMTVPALEIAVLSLFASTLTRNLLQALGAAIIVIGAFCGLGVWMCYESFANYDFYFWKGLLIVYIGVPALIAAVLGLALANYKRLDVGWNLWFRNLLVLSATVLVACTATALTFQRAWEWVTPLESRHGPARLSGPVRPKICFAGFKAFVLLPDGRLWTSKDYKEVWRGDYYDNNTHTGNGTNAPREKVMLPFPVDGEFVGTSTWTDMAASLDAVVGIEANGSLWKIFEERFRWKDRAKLSMVPEPQRIGTDSDWKAVAASRGYLLALKKDGTIWGWGNNEQGQLGPGPAQVTNDWVRVGVDSDWIQIFASGSSSYGIKRDGSVWKWGYDWKKTNTIYPESISRAIPLHCNLPATNWTDVSTWAFCDVALRADGTLWAEGRLPNNVLGGYVRRQPGEVDFSARPIRIGSDSDWSDVIANGGMIVGLKQDGAIFENGLYSGRNLWGGKVWQPSTFSDWVAIQNCMLNMYFAALAADGTLSGWEDPGFLRYQGRLLGPSRKPLWSVNIFAKAK